MPPNSRMSLVLCAFLACAGSTAQLVDPRTLPLLQASDVRYLGSFSVPQFQGRNETPEEALMYGGWALGISPRGLYWGGTDWHDKIAEISIPTVGGTSTKPVGMVCFGWIARGSKPRTATLHLPGDRAAVRDASVDAALSGLLELVGENPL